MEIHENAKLNLIEKSNEILIKIETLPTLNFPKDTIKGYNVPTITEDKIISTPIINERNGFSFYHNQIRFGLMNDKFKYFKVLVEQAWKSLKSNNLISYTYIEEKYKEWIVTAKTNQENINIFDFISNNYQSDASNYTVLIPIPFTSIGKDFRFGKIYFTTFNYDLIKDFFYKSDQKEDILKENILKKYSGYLVGIYNGRGDSYLVQDEAYENINKCLSFIRLFSPANQNAELISATDALVNGFNSKTFISLSKEKESFQYTEGIIDSGYFCSIPSHVIDIILSDEYKGFNDLFSDNMSKFEEKLLNSIMVYSKNTLKRDIFDKILYILSALEMIFLKNETEPIQQNLSERIALYIGDNLESRKKIIKIIKEIYQLRSRSVHHGKIEINNIEKVNNFLILAWATYKKLIFDHRHYNEVNELIEAIESNKLG